MNRILLFAFVVLLLPAAMSCSDGVTNPTTATRMESVSGNAQPGFTGIPLDEKLAVRVLDINNIPVPDEPVTWSVTSGGGSVTPVQTRTDASGVARTTWTLGLTAGAQSATANIGGLTPTTFSAIATQLGDTCAGNPIDIEVGGSVVVLGETSPVLCLASSLLGNREYVTLVFNSHRTASSFNFSITGTGIVAATGPPSPSPEMMQDVIVADASAYRDADFEARLREMELRDLAPLVNQTGARVGSESRSNALYSLSSPVLGELLTFNAEADAPCNVNTPVTARVMAITQRAILVADEANPAGGFSAAEYLSIAQTFDTLVYPRITSPFGQPEDIDNNNRIVLLYTKEVNKLTPQGSPTGFVAGFFFARDLFPRVGNGRLNGCANSNQSEMMYLMVPDPTGTINGNARQKDFVLARTISTLAHEMTHLLNASRRLFVNVGARYPERAWVEEGLAHSAEELLFLHASGLSTGSNITASAIQSSSQRVEAFNEFQSDNAARLRDYMVSTNTNWAHTSVQPTIVARGAATYFFRYVVDRLGGDETATWRSLLNSADTGMRNVEAVIQADPVQWMREWAMALYVDDAVSGIPARYTVPTWNLRSVMALFPPAGYSLRPFLLQNGVPRSSLLQPGGAHYYRLGVPAGGEGRLAVGAASAGTGLAVVVLRTR